MTYNNINLWFAKDANGKIITIDEVDKELKNTYYCPLCGSEVIARQGDIMSWHFAHIDKSKCDSESMVHFWIKNKLLEVGDTFKIKTDEELEFVVKDILIEQNYSVSNKIYNPDITIITECGETVYFEVANTNKKKVEEYLDIWIELGNIVVEVDSKDLINSQGRAESGFKALYYDGKCFNVNKRDSYYNTIGRYKEELNQCDVHNKKEIIKKLDWFWNDIKKYKKHEVTIEYMVSLIKEIEKETDLVRNILKKSCCTELYKDYKKYMVRDCVHEYQYEITDSNIIFKAVQIVKDKYKDIYEIELKSVRKTKEKSYLKGSRKHPIGYYQVFSHYEHYINLFFAEINVRVYITNKMVDCPSIDELITEMNKSIDSMEHKTKCIDCGKRFILNSDEIKFYANKGFKLPKRCKECRNERKTNQ